MHSSITNLLRPGLLLGSLFTSALLGSSASGQSWWPHDAMPTARHRLAVATAKHNVSNYAIFAFGGTNGGLTTYDAVEMFNPLTSTWSVRGPMPGKLHSMAAATADSASGERVYIFGGSPGAAPTTTVWEYDAVADTWNTSLPPLPKAVSYLSATTGIDGKIYVFGGLEDVAPYHSDEVFAFDPMTGTWGPSVPDMPRARSRHASVAGCDGLIYVMGGKNSSGAQLAMDVYDPVAGSWLALNPSTSTAWASIPGVGELEVTAATGRNGLIYMIGGDGYPYETGVMDSYDTNTNTWTSETSQPTTRNGQAAVGVGNSVYAIGGWKKFGGVQTATESRGGLPGSPSCVGIVHINPPGVIYCEAAPNSISQGGAKIDGAGSQSVGIAELTLRASPVPDQPGLFFYGANQIQVPFGEGFRCVGGGIRRMGVRFAQNGVLSTTVKFTGYGGAPNQFEAGTVWNFQAWYRDPAGGHSQFNLSDGYTVHFLP